MGEVNFVAFDAKEGRPTASISGAPADVADFISIWMKNNEDGISLSKQLGVDFFPKADDKD
jgi:hypothetical protein